jgi:hypothetical protein
LGYAVTPSYRGLAERFGGNAYTGYSPYGIGPYGTGNFIPNPMYYGYTPAMALFLHTESRHIQATRPIQAIRPMAISHHTAITRHIQAIRHMAPWLPMAALP